MPKFTVERQHRTFTDAHGVVVHYYVWSPGTPRAVVQLAHGVGEHALRYELLAQALVEAGYASTPTITAVTARRVSSTGRAT